MKHIFCLISALCLGIPSIFAVVAKPGFIDVRQPDGTMITIRMEGGPRDHTIYNVDDEIMRVDENGFYVVADEDYIQNIGERRKAKLNAKRKVGGLRSDPVPSTGDHKSLVILVEFSDMKFKLPDVRQYYEGMLNGDTFTEYESTGSAKQYYTENSSGKFNVSFDIQGPVTLDQSYMYYGQNDYWGDEYYSHLMIKDACDKLYEQGFNFTPYDQNNDKEIDMVYVFYAGYGEADGGGVNTVWPHSWDMIESGVKVSYNGLMLNHYACSNELQYYPDGRVFPDGLGTFCHEFCHVLGLPDIYSTLDRGAFTPCDWDLLDSGSYNNKSRTPPYLSAYERYVFDWIEPEEIDSNTEGLFRLPPVGESNKAFIIKTDNKDEYFILENRQQRGMDKYLPHHGMLVWHIDFNQKVWDNNTVNLNPRHQYIDLVEADGIPSNWTIEGDAFPGLYEKTEFSATTYPALVSWSGKDLGIEIKNIREASNGDIVFTVGDYDITTGLDEINCQEETLPRYFNLQGIEVLNPVKGQILIEKKGDSVRKVVI